MIGNNQSFSTTVDVSFSSSLESFPEPSTLTLLGIGSLGMIGYRWRRRKQAAG
jgi:hypothetical protein